MRTRGELNWLVGEVVSILGRIVTAFLLLLLAYLAKTLGLYDLVESLVITQLR